MAQEEITLKLKPDEINIILEGIGNLPFIKVYTLISKIQGQASAQLGGDNPSADGPVGTQNTAES